MAEKGRLCREERKEREVSFLDRHRNQLATYWAKGARDSSGDTTFATPKAITVRWERRSVVFTNAAGEEAMSDSMVFVKEDMEEGDYLLLGTSIVADPTSIAGPREIQGFSKIPQLVESDSERRAFLGSRSR